MARKYTKRNTAYWSSKGNAKVTVNKKSNVIFKDKGKNVTLKIVADKNKPLYHRRSV
jgi:hypothetical protein